MGLILLVVLYVPLAAAFVVAEALVARAWSLPKATLGAALILSLLPLAYTGAGFWPRQASTPTPMVADAPPWADPDLVRRIRENSSRANPILLDPVSQFIPWREAARSDLLLNPAQGAGAALLGNGQSAVLFPTEVVARYLPPFRAVTFSQAARLLLAAWGMFLLARAMALSEAAALVAAVVWTGSGFLQLWRLHPHTLVAAVAPWILAALVALARRPGPRTAVALALVGAIGFAGGHPQTLAQVLLFGLPTAALLLFRDPLAGTAAASPAQRLPRILGWGSVGAALSGLLAAPVLLPFVENLLVSSEWRFRAAAEPSLGSSLVEALDRLRVTLVLRALGHPIDGTWVGARNLAESGSASVGAAALVLVLLAALSVRGRGWVRPTLGLAVIALAVAVRVPGVLLLFQRLPLVGSTLLDRLSVWWVLVASLVAGVAVDRWRSLGGEPVNLRRWRVLVMGTATTVGAVLVWAAGAPWTLDPVVLATAWGGLAAVTLLLAAPPRSWAWALLATVLLLPRAAEFARWVPSGPPESFYLQTPAVAWLQARMAEGEPGGRVTGLQGALVPHAAAFFGLEEIRANDPMTFAPYEDFLLAVGPRRRTGWHVFGEPVHPVFSFLGVRYVVGRPDRRVRRGVPVAYEGRDARIYEVSDPLPRVYVPRLVTVLGNQRDALEAIRDVDDFGERTIVSGARFLPAAGTHGNGEASVHGVKIGPRRVAAVVEAAGPAVVATSQPAIPGWRIEVDGEVRGSTLVNGAFLGVEVQPGDRSIVLVYAPRSWRWGLVLGLLGLLGGSGLWWGNRVLAALDKSYAHV